MTKFLSIIADGVAGSNFQSTLVFYITGAVICFPVITAVGFMFDAQAALTFSPIAIGAYVASAFIVHWGVYGEIP